jgi:hypothetical protein
VRNSASGVKGRIQALAATKASAFKAGSDKARQAGRDTIQKGALDAAAKVQKNGEDAATEALASSAKLSQKLRDEGRKLADGLKTNTAQSDKSIRVATSGAVRRIDASGKKLLGQLDTVRSQTSTSLDKHKQDAGTSLHGDGEKTAAAIRAAGKAAAHKLGELAAGRVRTIDKAKQDAFTELVRAAAGKTLPQQAIAQLQASAGEMFKKAGGDARSALLDESQQALNKLAQAGQAVSAPLGKNAAQAIEAAHGVGGKATTSVGEITKTMAHDGKGAFADQKSTNDRVVKAMHDDLGKEVQNAQQGWTKQRHACAFGAACVRLSAVVAFVCRNLSSAVSAGEVTAEILGQEYRVLAKMTESLLAERFSLLYLDDELARYLPGGTLPNEELPVERGRLLFGGSGAQRLF